MHIPREELIRRVTEESGFYLKDTREVFRALQKVVMEYYGTVTDNEPVTIQLMEGIRIGCKIMPERERLHPSTLETIVVGETVKPFAKFSDEFREKIQKQYEKNYGNE
jgi:nucleoid DNA-binding protein